MINGNIIINFQLQIGENLTLIQTKAHFKLSRM